MKLRYLLNVMMVAVITVASCEKNKTERDLWESLNISNYHMDQIVLCFCPDADTEYTVYVKGDSIYSIIENQTQQPVKLLHTQFYTIAGLFDLIENAYDQNAAVLKVEYDERYHFPRRIEIDYSRQLIDEEITVLISHFEVDP